MSTIFSKKVTYFVVIQPWKGKGDANDPNE